MTLKMSTIWIIVIGCIASGCGGGGLTATNSNTQPPPATQDSAALDLVEQDSTEDITSTTLLHKTYEGSNAPILNPERGYFYWTDLLESNYANARDLGYTLIYARVFLKDYVNKPLDDALLQKLDKAFQSVRQAGVKCILRFTYSDSQTGITDAPLELILQHIAQLKPLLGANSDVIYTMQAGFIGSWGEWHTSTNGLDINAEARKKVLNAVLDALPSTRHVQVRTPMFKDSYASLGGADPARVGHHNDCFLASTTDYGTYPDIDTEVWKSLVGTDGLSTPVGGETCVSNPPRSSCETALKELAALHFSFLNGSPFGGVMDTWKAEGCAEEIGRRLGYRFALNDAEFNDHIRPGAVLHLKLNLQNDGYAPLYTTRNAYLVLEGAVAYTAKLDIDWTLLKPGMQHTVEVNIALPKEIAKGTYTLSLWLPDPSPTLKDNPQYDILLANKAGNLLSDAIVVDPTANIYPATADTTFNIK